MPQVLDYNEVVQTPSLCFNDPELKTAKAATNAMGWPMPYTGNFAAVYKLTATNGNVWAVKCFTRPVTTLQARYQAISEHIQLARSRSKISFMIDFEYQEQGIRVRNEWHPILKMRWVEGELLNQFVRKHIDEPETLLALSDIWVRLGRDLRASTMAHADLQHGNVILVPKPRGVSVRLIDYDGMYVPALDGKSSGELGHSGYQHPGRKVDPYHLEVDRFPNLVIYTALRALALGGRALWNRFDNEDNLLFREADLRNPGSSPLYRELWSIPDPSFHALVAHQILAGLKHIRSVPLLHESLESGKFATLTSEEEATVNAILAASPTASSVQPKPAPRVPEPLPLPPAPMPLPWSTLPSDPLPLPPEPLPAPPTPLTLTWKARPAAAQPLPLEPLTLPWNTRPPEPLPLPLPPEPLPLPPEPLPLEDSLPFPPLPASEPRRPRIRIRDVLLDARLLGVLGAAVAAVLVLGLIVMIMRPGRKPVAISKTEPGDLVAVDPAGETTPTPLPDPQTTITPIPQPPLVPPMPQAETPKPKIEPPPVISPPSPPIEIVQPPVVPKSNIEPAPTPAFVPTPTPISPATIPSKSLTPTTIDPPLREWTGTEHIKAVQGVAFSRDGKLVVSGSQDHFVQLWDAIKGTPGAHLAGEGSAPVLCVALSDDGKLVASGDEQGYLKVWDLSSNRLVLRLRIAERGINSIAISGDNKRIVCGGQNSFATVVNLATESVARTLLHGDIITSVAISRDGKRILCGCINRTVSVWNVDTGREERPFQEHKRGVYGVALSRDGRLAVSGGLDGKVKIWDPNTAREVAGVRLDGHSSGVMCVAISDDNKWIASGDDSGKLILWDATTGQRIKDWNGHTKTIHSVSFNGSNTQLVSGGFDKTVRVWNVP